MTFPYYESKDRLDTQSVLYSRLIPGKLRDALISKLQRKTTGSHASVHYVHPRQHN